MPSARETALRTLITFRRDGSWPDLYLKKALAALSREDAAFASALTYGVLQQRSLIDFYISQFSSQKLGKIMPQVLDALRCGVYQLVFMDKVPSFAAVNETVALVKKLANPRAGAFANAVLHRIAENKDSLRQPADPATLYSHPAWLVEKLMSQIGREDCIAFLKANNEPAPVYIRTNTLKISSNELRKRLADKGIEAEDAGLRDALVCKGALAQTEEFKNGLFYIQDLSSQLAVHLLAPQKGDTLIDMCASPGGKSLLAAQLMQNTGKITAMDLYPHKAELIEENAERLGVSILRSVAADSSKKIDRLEKTADKIICDVPCSGIGIIRKKPDIRYKNPSDIEALPGIQSAILKTAASYLKPGGRLLYSTCTVLREENRDVVDRFLAKNSDFFRIPFENPVCGSTDGSITLFPHVNGTDGFFITLLGRK